jgi:tol-pal system protein YbgF
MDRLEAEIGELQAMVAALQSLVKSTPDIRLPQESASDAAPQAAGPADPGLTARIDALETQIGAISGQLEMMTQQLGALDAKLNGGGGNNAPQPLAPLPGDEPLQPLPGEAPGREGLAPQDRRGPSYASAGEGEQFPSSIFAASPETPLPQESTPDDAPLPLNGSQGVGAEPPQPEAPERLAALPGNDPVSLYNQGYGDLLRGDYASAEISFRKVVTRFPTEPLAGKAQYWLGETYYARGEFKAAAEAFLKSYKQYQSGEKAPDSLLKLGMALAELGQKDAACSTFNEFGAKYPRADAQLQGEARAERRKIGC